MPFSLSPVEDLVIHISKSYTFNVAVLINSVKSLTLNYPKNITYHYSYARIRLANTVKPLNLMVIDILLHPFKILLTSYRTFLIKRPSYIVWRDPLFYFLGNILSASRRKRRALSNDFSHPLRLFFYFPTD